MSGYSLLRVRLAAASRQIGRQTAFRSVFEFEKLSGKHMQVDTHYRKTVCWGVFQMGEVFAEI